MCGCIVGKNGIAQPGPRRKKPLTAGRRAFGFELGTWKENGSEFGATPSIGLSKVALLDGFALGTLTISRLDTEQDTYGGVSKMESKQYQNGV